MEADNRSTLLEKLPRETLSNLESAIIHRTPPTFRACFEEFSLADHGISFSAFYRFARRLRDQARLTRLAEISETQPETALAAIPQLVANQLVDVLTTENPSSRTVARLANAYRHFITAQVARRRLDFAELDHKENERTKELKDLTDSYIRINKLKLADIQGDLALMKVGRTPNPITTLSEAERQEAGLPCGTGLPTGQTHPPHDARAESQPQAQADIAWAPPTTPSKSRAQASRQSPQAPSLKSQASIFDSIGDRVAAALDSRLPPSLRTDRNPSNGELKKHRRTAPT